ncbi:MAG: ASKHA domain-containing protein [Roseburia sp.]|nr:ASKHA domain-containing protein [Roseburia sp.]
MLAVDIGTTSAVCFLLDGKTGAELARSSMLNPQTVFGADVVSRIKAALEGNLERQKQAIQQGVGALIQAVCRDARILPEDVGVVSIVGNPAMQQLFLGILPANLASVPFSPALTQAKRVPCADYLPVCPNAELLIVPDISGFIGADTMGCILAVQLYRKEELTLIVDIGTNGEIVLGNREYMAACSAAAGPALEGANIQFGMRGTDGAIDHVWLENGEVKCSVIGGGKARGICGSGLVDAIAAGLDLGLLNKRGRILNEDRILPLMDGVFLTQEDVRQVQLAKGAIHAGISLLAERLGSDIRDIRKVQLAGAFGSHLDPESACRIGLLPEGLRGRIETIGNAAGSGAKMLACDKSLLPLTQKLLGKIEFLELASLGSFSKTFARSMNFQEEVR